MLFATNALRLAERWSSRWQTQRTSQPRTLPQQQLS